MTKKILITVYNSVFQHIVTKKMRDLMIERCIKGVLNPIGFVLCVKTVESDIRMGQDGYTGKKIQASQVRVFNSEIQCLAKCYGGDDFGKEVENVLKDMDDFS